MHLDWQTLIVLFFFWLPSYLNLPLFLPRTQIKQLGSFISLPSLVICQAWPVWTCIILYSATSNLNMAWSRLDYWAIHQVWLAAVFVEYDTAQKIVVAFWLATFLVFSLGFIFTFLLTICFSCLLIILLRHTLFSFFNFHSMYTKYGTFAACNDEHI